MQELKQEITDIREKIAENKLLITRKELELGNLLTSSAPEALTNSPLEELGREIQELLTIEPGKKKEISRMLSIEEEIKKIEQTIKEKKTAIGEKEKEIRQHYQDIGAAAYAAFKNNPGLAENYQDIFSEIINLEIKAEKAGQRKNDLPGDETGKKNFFSRFINTTRNIYYEKKEDFYTNRRNASYKTAGKKIMDSDFVQAADDAFLNEQTLPVRDIHGVIKSREEEILSLERKNTQLSEDLAELGVKTSTIRRIKDLEKEIEQTHHTLDQKYRDLGKLYREHEGELKVSLKELDNITSAIRKLETENGEYHKQIVKLNARIEISKLQQKITRNNEEMDTLKERISRDKSEIKTLTKANNDLEQEIAALSSQHNLSPEVVAQP